MKRVCALLLSLAFVFPLFASAATSKTTTDCSEKVVPDCTCTDGVTKGALMEQQNSDKPTVCTTITHYEGGPCSQVVC